MLTLRSSLLHEHTKLLLPRGKRGMTPRRAAADIPEPKRNIDNTHVARHWLKECQHSHDECVYHSTDSDPALPSRVIDVLHLIPDGRPIPYLVDSQGTHSQYATLSYVWGSGRRFVASQETLSQLRKCINLHDLPKLFQDAITLTRQIGIPYLWIDALCTVQDEPQDIAHELSRMTDIYRNSTLTLAAVGQHSVHNDVIRNRIYSHVPVDSGWSRIKAYLECTAKDGRFYIYLPCGHPTTLTYPLHKRAWCLQETLLSQRILVLGLGEMYWFCNSYERHASSFKPKRQRQPGDVRGGDLRPCQPLEGAGSGFNESTIQFLVSHRR